jgi:hypothetical protein
MSETDPGRARMYTMPVRGAVEASIEPNGSAGLLQSPPLDMRGGGRLNSHTHLNPPPAHIA